MESIAVSRVVLRKPRGDVADAKVSPFAETRMCLDFPVA